MKKFLPYVVCVVIFCLGFGGVFLYLESNKYDFKAQSIHGEVRLSDLKDTYKIVYFGYMSCPDVCPTTLTLLQEALQELESKGVDSSKITLVFVSLDPQRDELQALDTYAKYFYKNALGLRLEPQKLKSVAAHYGIKYEQIPLQDSDLDYSIAHSSFLYLLDTHTHLQATITNLTYDEILSSITKLIQRGDNNES